ncbi:hypothetical protein [Anatilimnocola floriformis]|uniref:hypothetical protein n=1 Tax=Anatilimnocola floriformis TaxID=2948575 RepID=UPI0020C2C030|nr:hypothetical protein [Anatilimnocola floriformis]
MTPTSLLSAKARALLERRNITPGIAYYWRTQWRRQLLFVVIYLAMVSVLYAAHWHLAATLMLGFVIGRTVRDIRWYQTLAREWPSNEEMLDWQKIERLAAEDPS